MRAISKLLALAVFAAMTLSVVNSSFAAEQKLGHMDFAKVFDEYNKTKDFDKQLEAKGNAKQGDREKLVTEIKKLKDELDLAADKDKAKKQAVVEEKLKKLQEFDRDSREALRKERDDMARGIFKEIKDVVDEIGKKESYKYIIDSRMVLFGNEIDDMTARVLKILNDKYATKGKK
ncbi:MAG: OmpH family outer membrane protein [Candidatus Omnitrophota bacterium]